MSESEQLELFDYREDTLKGVFGSMAGSGIGSFHNPLTGVGSSRDPSQYFTLNAPYYLTHNDRISLVEGSRICQNIVQVYPFEASWGDFSFSTGRSKNGGAWIKSKFESFQLGSLHTCFIEASVEARLHGESYVLLGVDDGQTFDKELRLDSINSFNWVTTFVYNQVEKHPNKTDIYIITLGDVNNNKHDVLLPGKSNKKLEVHKSRLLKFIGDYLPKSILQKRKRHQSSLQCAYDGFSLAMQAILNTNAMMTDHSLFWYKLDGLAQLVRNKKFDEIYNRFLTLQMSKSVLKGLAMDAKSEDVGFINRSYSGVKDILETMLDYMVAETGMVRFKVLGTANRAGLGAEGRGLQDRLEHSLKIKSWQKVTWKDNLFYCIKLLLSDQNSITRGKLPADLTLTFPTVIELTPKEIAELHDANQSWITKAIDSGILNPLEARLSIFGNNESILNPVITLDQRFTDLLESDLEAQSDPIDPIDTGLLFNNQPVVSPIDNDTDSKINNLSTESIDTGINDSQQQSLTQWVKTNLDSLETLLGIDLESKLDLIEFDPKSNKWVLYDSSKSRIIGKYRTEQDAKRKEKQINFFKHLKSNPNLQSKLNKIRSDNEDIINASLDDSEWERIRTLLGSKTELNESKIQSILGAL